VLKSLSSRSWRRGGLLGLLTVAALVLVPATPAAAIQTVSWTTSPPASLTVGQTYSLAFTGTANTFLGARITGCFVNFPDGNNYTNSYGGNFTTGTCSYSNRMTTQVGTNTVTGGFNLSNGGTMTLSWNIAVSAPNPTVSVPSNITTAATSVNGAAVAFSSYAYDGYYGTYGATCSPASGSTFAVGTTTVSCSATNPSGKTGTGTFSVTVNKSSPALLWSPSSSVVYGTTYADLSTAAMQAADASGTITYARADGTSFIASDLIPVGDSQVLTATYTPSGAAASSYDPVTVEREITVVRATSAVSFGSGTPTIKQYGDAQFVVGVSGTAGAGAVTVTSQSGSDCTVSSSGAGASVVATVTITGAGSCVLLADQLATTTHTEAPTAQWSVTIAKANPQITWVPLSSLTYGDPVSDLLGATADVPGTFAYLVDGNIIAPDAVIDVADVHTVSVTFSPDDARNYVEATADHEFAVTPAAQSLTVGAIGDQAFGAEPFDLVIGGEGPGDVSATATGACTIDDLTVALVAAGECTLTVSKAATSNYAAATSVVRTFAVEPGVQTLTVAAIADTSFGTQSFLLDIGGTGPGVVSATATGSCAVDDLTVTVVSDGLCTITVNKASTSNYLAATPVTRSFTVAPAIPILIDATLAPAKVGTAYSAAITAEPADATTFAITAGALPAGLGLNPTTGVISGTPQTSGSFEFTITATNAGGPDSAVFTIQVSLPAGKISVGTPRLFTVPGATVKLTISGLAPNEEYSVALRGVELAEGTASSTGKSTVSVAIPKTTATGKTFLDVTGSTAERTGRASQTIVSASKKLTFSLSPKPIVQSNRTLKITVHGLAAGEPVKVTFRGKTVSPKTATANSKGDYTVKVSAGWSWGYKTITATGSSAKRYGATKIDVEARR
jgi:hypothetical protein